MNSIKELLDVTEKETIVEALESLADFVKDSAEYPEDHKGYRVFMAPALYEALVEEVGHEVNMIRGIRVQVTKPEDIKNPL